MKHLMGKKMQKDAVFFHQISLTIQVRQWIFYEVILKFKHPHGPPEVETQHEISPRWSHFFHQASKPKGDGPALTEEAL